MKHPVQELIKTNKQKTTKQTKFYSLFFLDTILNSQILSLFLSFILCLSPNPSLELNFLLHMHQKGSVITMIFLSLTFTHFDCQIENGLIIKSENKLPGNLTCYFFSSNDISCVYSRAYYVLFSVPLILFSSSAWKYDTFLEILLVRLFVDFFLFKDYHHFL